jgi:hypothetical protein
VPLIGIMKRTLLAVLAAAALLGTASATYAADETVSTSEPTEEFSLPAECEFDVDTPEAEADVAEEYKNHGQQVRACVHALKELAKEVREEWRDEWRQWREERREARHQDRDEDASPTATATSTATPSTDSVSDSDDDAKERGGKGHAKSKGRGR